MIRTKKGEKGIAIIWLAMLLLPLILAFAGLAVDIAYMYVVKNSLQVSADAAALAGAALIGNADDLTQSAARSEAINYAAKNTAAGRSVQLASDGTNGLSPGNDVTVGFWDAANRKYTAGQTPVNAIEVRPRRTSDSPGGPASIFWGPILSFFGRSWSVMSAAAHAVAAKTPGGPLAVPLCVQACGMNTPLSVTSPNTTFGTRFYAKTGDGSPNFGWTTFLDNSTSQPDITDYITGNQTPPPICQKCIFTTQGIVNPSFCAILEKIRTEGSDYMVNGVKVHGWKVTVPILPDIPCAGGTGHGCFGDPGYQPKDPYLVTQYAQIIITDSIPSGNCPGVPGPYSAGKTGLVIVGMGAGTGGNSTIECQGCDTPAGQALLSSNAKLVE